MSVPPLARIASLIGDPARSLMLSALMDGRSRSAGELARIGGVSPQTASTHLAKLIDGGLLAISRQGRHRYHRLASHDVSNALESLMVVSAPRMAEPLPGTPDRALRHARSCYDHLAGRLAVDLANHWLALGWIRPVHSAPDRQQWQLSGRGRRGLAALQIPLPDEALRRPAVRPCLDWSERQPHIGGQLGAILLNTLLSRRLLHRQPQSRALRVSDEGAQLLRQWGCGLQETAAAQSAAPCED